METWQTVTSKDDKGRSNYTFSSPSYPLAETDQPVEIRFDYELSIFLFPLSLMKLIEA
jgi:hypothetical protein